MTRFEIPNMTCGHCVMTVMKAVKSVDPGAEVQADLATRGISVISTAEVARLSAAIAAAGYANTPQT
jgi:copper chaperone